MYFNQLQPYQKGAIVICFVDFVFSPSLSVLKDDLLRLYHCYKHSGSQEQLDKLRQLYCIVDKMSAVSSDSSGEYRVRLLESWFELILDDQLEETMCVATQDFDSESMVLLTFLTHKRDCLKSIVRVKRQTVVSA